MIKKPSIKLPTAIRIPTKPVTPSTPRNSGLDEKKKGKGHATKSTEPEEQAEESNQQTEKCQQLEDDLKQQLTSLMEETLESKEDSMMKEGNKEMEKSFPTLPHVHQVKDVSLAMVVPIVDFVIPEKYNVPIGEQVVPLSSWFQAPKKRKALKVKLFIHQIWRREWRLVH